MLSWIRSALLDNLSLKLFSLLLAIVLFRRVNQEDLVRVATVDVKLVYEFPKKLMMTSDTVNSIKVTLQGPESLINTVIGPSRGWKYTVGFSDATPGPMQTELYTQEIRSIFPGQIQVTRIKPSILNVRFEERAKRSLPIKIQLKGNPPLGYTVLRPIRPYPQVLEVEGPKEIVSKLTHLETQVVDLSSQNSDETLWMKLSLPHKYVRFLGSNVVRVMLQVQVVKGSKQFDNLPIKAINLVNPKLDYELQTKQLSMTLVGPLAQLSVVKPADIVIEADVSKIATLKPGEHTVPLKIRLPAPDLKLLKPDRTVIIRTKFRDGFRPEGANSPDAGGDSRPEPPARRLKRKPRRRKWRKRKRRPNKRKVRRRATKSPRPTPPRPAARDKTPDKRTP